VNSRQKDSNQYWKRFSLKCGEVGSARISLYSIKCFFATSFQRSFLLNISTLFLYWFNFCSSVIRALENWFGWRGIEIPNHRSENSLKKGMSLEINGSPWAKPSNIAPDPEVTLYGRITRQRSEKVRINVPHWETRLEVRLCLAGEIQFYVFPYYSGF
jgi:hypothetical protein